MLGLFRGFWGYFGASLCGFACFSGDFWIPWALLRYLLGIILFFLGFLRQFGLCLGAMFG